MAAILQTPVDPALHTTYNSSVGRLRKRIDDSDQDDRTYFINAFLLVKGTRQEKAAHGLFLLGKEDKILPNAHGAPEKEAEMGYSPRDSNAHLKKEQIHSLDMTGTACGAF